MEKILKRGRVALLNVFREDRIAWQACRVAYDRLRRLSRHCSHIQYMQLAFNGDAQSCFVTPSSALFSLLYKQKDIILLILILIKKSFISLYSL
jgi:hypothetical protein